MRVETYFARGSFFVGTMYSLTGIVNGRRIAEDVRTRPLRGCFLERSNWVFSRKKAVRKFVQNKDCFTIIDIKCI